MLDIKPDGIYVDATLGGAGHSSYLLSQLSEKGHLYCFDQDQKAIDNAQVRLKDYIDKGMVTFIKDNFRNLKSNLEALGVSEIDGILYDLGVSSPVSYTHLVGLLSFIVSLFINLVFSVILSNTIGTLIVRSSRQKLYSTILMTLSTLLIMFPIMMVGFRCV